MNILINEEQLIGLLVDHINHWTPEKKERIKMKTMVAAMKYPDMATLSAKNPLVYARVRKFGLEDVCFPDRKTYRKRGEGRNPEMVKYHAKFYKNAHEFNIAEPSLFQYAYELDMLDDLFPKKDNEPVDDTPKDKQSRIDAYIQRASSSYKTPEQLKQENPKLYQTLADMGHFDKDGFDYIR